jgi:hypothetical protein
MPPNDIDATLEQTTGIQAPQSSVDLPAVSPAPAQRALPAFQSPQTAAGFGDARKQRQQQLLAAIGAQQVKVKAKQAAALQSPQFKSRQLLGMLALAALPVLLGASRGRQGLQAGGLVGAQAASGFANNIRQQQERDRQRLLLEAQAEQKALGSLQGLFDKNTEAQLASQTRIEEAQEKERLGLGPKGNNTNVNVDMGFLKDIVNKDQAKKAAEDRRQDLTGAREGITDAVRILDVIDNGVKDGQLDPNESTLQAYVRDLGVKINPSSAAGDLSRAMASRLLNSLQRVKGNANEKEFFIAELESGMRQGMTIPKIKQIAQDFIAHTARGSTTARVVARMTDLPLPKEDFEFTTQVFRTEDRQTGKIRNFPVLRELETGDLFIINENNDFEALP